MTGSRVTPRILVAALGLAACAVGEGPRVVDVTPPPDAAIPNDSLGRSIRRGLALVTNTRDSLPGHTASSLRCASCHLDAGRRRGAATLVGVTARFPKYMERTGGIVTIEDRVNYCVTRSLAGRALPATGRDMRDVVAYLAFLSSGVPSGAHVRDEGLAAMPRLTGDTTRGAALFVSTCASCHGARGQGAPPAIPALWGATSYGIGASMAREERAASFIRRFMPFNTPGALSDQQAYDVAAYVNSHARPDSPGKERDWPRGGAPYDVPYATRGHAPYRAPAAPMAGTSSSSPNQ